MRQGSSAALGPPMMLGNIRELTSAISASAALASARRSPKHTPLARAQDAGTGLRCLRLCLCHLLPIKADEIDRVEHQWRKAPAHNGPGHDLARERKQQPRAFDHDDRTDLLLGNVLQAEDAGINQLEIEHDSCAELCCCVVGAGPPVVEKRAWNLDIVGTG
jgi:hypothetical protein